MVMQLYLHVQNYMLALTFEIYTSAFMFSFPLMDWVSSFQLHFPSTDINVHS